MFKFPKINLSLQLAALFLFALLFGKYVPVEYKSVFYAISLTFKEILLFVLPLIIFTCLFHGLSAYQGKAFRFVALILVAVCVSNFVSILAAYGLGVVALPKIGSLALSNDASVNSLLPTWTVVIPSLFENTNLYALSLGSFFGLLFSILPYQAPIRFANHLNRVVTFILQKLIVPGLPIFALGYILKIQHEGILSRVFETYGPIILLVIVGNLLYLLVMFWFAANFNFSRFVGYLRNMIPVGVLGFTTMSSMATMPATLNAAEKNTNNKDLSQAIIPATVNIHMIGDSIIVPILAMATLLTFGQSLPTFAQYLLFTQLFMIIKFSVPGIPGGTMLVLIPVLEKAFGFTSEMSAFMAAIYILFDPLITVGNVLGNSALAILLTRVMGLFKKPAEVPQESLG